MTEWVGDENLDEVIRKIKEHKPTIQDLVIARALLDRIIEELEKPHGKKRMGRRELPRGYARFPHLGPPLKPPAAALWRWLFDTFYRKRWKAVKGGWVSEDEVFVHANWDDIRREVERLFRHLPRDEQEAWLSQYRSYSMKFKYTDMPTFLKEVYGMTWDDLVKASNDEKKRLWEEFFKSETVKE